MRAATLVALAVSASAARVEEQASWLTHRKRWCLSEEINPFCDGKTIIDIQSAFYAAEWAEKCEDFTPTGSRPTCEMDATAEVNKICQGQVTCNIPPSFHSSACTNVASMRIIWDCVAGGPETAEEDTQHRPPVPKELSEEAAKELKEGVPVKISEEAANEVEKEAKEQEAIKCDGPTCTDAVEMPPVPAEPEKAKDAATEVVEKVKKEATPHAHEAIFNPCYRRRRWDLIKSGDIFDKLTSCPNNEGCFKLFWADGKVFKDPKTPPTREDMMAASLKQGEDSLHVTFFSVGLERNDYDTWGICLPKDEGVDLATAVFNSLRQT